MGRPSRERRPNKVGRRQEQASAEASQVHETRRPLFLLPLRRQGPPHRRRGFRRTGVVLGGRWRRRCRRRRGGWGNERTGGFERDEEGDRRDEGFRAVSATETVCCAGSEGDLGEDLRIGKRI